MSQLPQGTAELPAGQLRELAAAPGLSELGDWAGRLGVWRPSWLTGAGEALAS